MRLISRVFVISAVLLAAFVGGPARAYEFALTGLEGELRENVEVRLRQIPPEEAKKRQTYRAMVDKAVREGLRALGYYRPTIKYRWDREADGKRGKKLNVTVAQGEPVRIAAVSFTVEGEAKDDKAFAFLRRHLAQKGDIVNHGTYEAFKEEVIGMATRRGYFDGEFTRSMLGVNADTGQAYWWLVYNSGKRYKFGRVKFEGSQIKEKVLENLVPFKEGEYYHSSKVSTLNNRLSSTGWFNSVVVAPDMDAGRASEDKTLPFTGTVSPRKANSIEVGLGFSTDTGPRVKGVWTKPWLNSSGDSLSTSSSISKGEQLVDFSYRMPLEEQALEEYWVYQGGFKRTDLNDTDSRSATLMVGRNWDYETGWQRALSLRWSFDSYTQGSVSENTMLLYPGIAFTRTRTRGGVMPFWGDYQRYSLDVSGRVWGSDIDFAIFNAQWGLVRTYAKKHRFVLRGNFGWIETNDFDKVPPDLRFFAGGDRSIRGYDYKSISPTGPDGELRGGQRMLTAGLEYQYNVYDKWWGAVFFDAGDVTDDLRDISIKKGAGVGIRWASPVGPIRFDVARPVGGPDKSWRFYFGLGPEF